MQSAAGATFLLLQKPWCKNGFKPSNSEQASSSRAGSQEPHSTRQEPELPLPGEGQGLWGPLELQGSLQAHTSQTNTAGVSFLLDSLGSNQQLSYCYKWLGRWKDISGNKSP